MKGPMLRLRLYGDAPSPTAHDFAEPGEIFAAWKSSTCRWGLVSMAGEDVSPGTVKLQRHDGMLLATPVALRYVSPKDATGRMLGLTQVSGTSKPAPAAAQEKSLPKARGGSPKFLPEGVPAILANVRVSTLTVRLPLAKAMAELGVVHCSDLEKVTEADIRTCKRAGALTAADMRRALAVAESLALKHPAPRRQVRDGPGAADEVVGDGCGEAEDDASSVAQASGRSDGTDPDGTASSGTLSDAEELEALMRLSSPEEKEPTYDVSTPVVDHLIGRLGLLDPVRAEIVSSTLGLLGRVLGPEGISEKLALPHLPAAGVAAMHAESLLIVDRETGFLRVLRKSLRGSGADVEQLTEKPWTAGMPARVLKAFVGSL